MCISPAVRGKPYISDVLVAIVSNSSSVVRHSRNLSLSGSGSTLIFADYTKALPNNRWDPMLKAVSISLQNLRRPCVSVFSQLRVLGSYMVVSNYPMYTTQGNFIIYVVVYPINLSKQKII